MIRRYYYIIFNLILVSEIMLPVSAYAVHLYIHSTRVRFILGIYRYIYIYINVNTTLVSRVEVGTALACVRIGLDISNS